MSVVVVALRIVALLAFAAPMLLRNRDEARAGQSGGWLAPVIANFVAFGAFLPALLFFSSRPDEAALVPAAWGSLAAVAGAALVLRSRAELGTAWSFTPKADQHAGLVTTGPYRTVRHPIYLGLTLVATGQAIAFASWPALLVVFAGIIPTFAWRAHAEERVLAQAFGDDYRRYQRQTKMIIPYLL